ncbi:carboxypeptidase B-like [Ornithodoros turicata]
MRLDPDGKVHYDGHTVFRLYPRSTTQLEFLYSLEDNDTAGYDFWIEPSYVDRFVDVSVAPEEKRHFVQELQERNISSEVLIEDVQAEIHNSTTGFNDTPDLRYSRSFFNDYQRLSTIHNYLEGLTIRRKELATVVNIGKSFEGKELRVLKLSTGSAKMSVWLDGGMHAREWISPATVTYILEELVGGYGNDNDTTKILDTFDIYGLPVANPDGYEHTHKYNRLWRKTRSTTSSYFCRGADPNRNFGYQWYTGGSSNRPCSEIYAGSKAFSEPETKAISNFIYARRKEMLAYVTFHSYSQLWLTPWGFTPTLPKTYRELERVARIATEALKQVHGTQYTVGTSTNLLYVASGGSDDWAHGEAHIPFSYTVELRDKGRYGFMLPREQIIPTGEETWAGIKAMLLELVNKV